LSVVFTSAVERPFWRTIRKYVQNGTTRPVVRVTQRTADVGRVVDGDAAES